MAREIPRVPFHEFSDNIAAFFARVAREHESLVVEGAEGELVVLKPLRSTKARLRSRRRTAADHEAFLSSFGSWSDVDADTLIKDIYESRSISSRPPVEL